MCTLEYFNVKKIKGKDLHQMPKQMQFAYNLSGDMCFLIFGSLTKPCFWYNFNDLLRVILSSLALIVLLYS